jgi:hypothetical protein
MDATMWQRMVLVAAFAGVLLAVPAATAPKVRFPGLWASATAVLLGMAAVGVVTATAETARAGWHTGTWTRLQPLGVALALGAALAIPLGLAWRRDGGAGGCLFWLPRVLGALALVVTLGAGGGVAFALRGLEAYAASPTGDKEAVMRPFQLATAVGVVGGLGGAVAGIVAILCGTGLALWRRFGPRPDVPEE